MSTDGESTVPHSELSEACDPLIRDMGRRLRVAATLCEAERGAVRVFTLTLTPAGMREIARRLDGGGVTEDLRVYGTLARARRTLSQAVAHERDLREMRARMSRWEVGTMRAVGWSLVVAAAAQVLASAALDLMGVFP